MDQAFSEGELTSFRLTVGAGFGAPDTVRIRYRDKEITADVRPGDRIRGTWDGRSLQAETIRA